MNKNFRSVWNACKQAFVAAAETVASRGRPCGGMRSTVMVAALLGSLLLQAGQALAAPPAPTAAPAAPAAPAAGQLPTGGQVSAGQAGIAQRGASMVITQGSERAAINWQRFDVGAGAQVEFKQPGASSVMLNRVLSNDPSQIFGRISANGQVILSNPSGVYFSPDARVDVGGLVATTHGIGDAAFMAGQARFERNGSTASVVNEGALKAALGGYIALLAPEVRNQGAVIAQMGTVALAAGEAIDLRFDSNNRLTSLRVDPGELQALVDNRHVVQAPGGLVILSAQAMDRLVGGVVRNSGQVEASGLQVQDGGRIVLSGSSRVEQAGSLAASSGAQAGQGGQISLQGDQITLQDGSRIDASGAQGGGAVRVGGGWQGSADPLLAATGQAGAAATTVTLAPDARIAADATRAGDGGQVVLWSDVARAGSRTTVDGTISARGGATAGHGGQIETSGHQLQVDGAKVDASAARGTGGQWLLDPYNITISSNATSNVGSAGSTHTAANNASNLNASTVTAALNSGTSVVVQTAAGGSEIGDLQVNAAITKTAGADASLTLKAHNNVVVNSAITSSSNKLHVNLLADTDKDGAGIHIVSANLASNGGNIAFGDGSTVSVGGVMTQVGGDVYVRGASALAWSTAGGSFTVNGQTLIGNAQGLGIDTANGAITFNGSIDSANQYTSVYTSSGLDWTNALSVAKSGTGANVGDSYLATVTTRLENAIASQTVNYNASWLGGRRVTGLGTDTAWRWVSGPEGLTSNGNGLVFFNQTANGAGGSAAGGYFSNWNPGEPNNWSGSGANPSSMESESALQFTGSLGKWNDLPRTSTALNYYVRETNATASPLTLNAGSAAVRFNGGVGGSKALASLAVTSGATVVVNGNALATTGAQTYNTPLTVSAGSSDVLFSGSSVTVPGAVAITGGNVTFNANLSTSTTGGDVTVNATSLGGSGNMALADNRSLNVALSGPSVTPYSGVISGNGIAMTKSGSGTWVLTGTNTYAGSTTIAAGTLQLGNGGSTGSVATTSITNNGTLALNVGADTTLASAISGTGGLNVIGASNTLSSGFLTTTAQTIATNTTVAELLHRLAGARQNGLSINGSGTLESGVYLKSFNPLTNTATLQFQQYDGTYTKAVFVKLTQSGSNVQAVADTSTNTGTGAGYTSGNTLGADMSTGSSSMPLAASAGAPGYNVDQLYLAGKVTLTGTNSFSGGTTISNAQTTGAAGNLYTKTAPGTLQVSGAANLGSGNVANSGLLIFNDSAAQAWGGTASGSGVLLKNGANTLTITGNQTSTGNTIVNAGTLQVGNGGTTGALASASHVLLPTAGANLAVNRSDDLTMGNVLNGVGTLQKVGSNALTLSGTTLKAAAFNIDAGSLVVQGNAPTASGSFNGPGALRIEPASTSFSSAFSTAGWSFGSTLGGLTLGKSGNTQDITVANAIGIAGPITAIGGTVNANAGLTTTNADTGDVTVTAATGLTGSGGVALASGRTLTINQAGNTTYSGVVSGSNANLVKGGAGDLSLAGASTYGGSTTVNAGILSLAAADRLPDSTTLTVNTGGTFSLNGYNESVGSIAGNGLIVNGAVVRDGLVLWLDAGNTASYNGSGSTWYDLSGNHYDATLVGNPGYNAATSLFSFTSNTQYVQIATLPAGFLQRNGTVGGITVFSVANFGTAQNWERMVDLGNAAASPNNPNHNIILSRVGTTNRLDWEIYNGASGTTENKVGANSVVTDNVKGSYAGTADGSNLRIFRDGALTTTTASTALPAAVVRSSNYIGKSNWQQDDTFRGDIGTLMVYNRALSQAEIAKNHQLLFNRATATLSVGGNNTSTSFGGTIENGVGTLNLVKQGSGTLTLGGANSYAGTTTVSGGTLRNGAADAVPRLSAVSVAIGATWDLDGHNNTVGSVTGAGSITLGAGRLTTGGLDTSTSYSGVLSGSGGITKTGAGIWTLSGPSSFSGATTVAAGTLASGGADSLSDASAVTVAAGATLNLAGNSDTIGSLAGAGSVALGGTTLTSGADNTSTTFSGSLTGSNGNLAKTGSGTFTLTGSNSYTGTTTVNAGTLAVGNGGGTGTLGSGTVTSNATLAFNRAGAVALGTLAPNAAGITGSGAVTATAGTDLTIDRPLNVGGAVTLSASAGNLAINSAMASGTIATLGQTGTLTDGASGSITADQLRLQGGNVTLDSAANTVATLAASGVGSLNYLNSTALAIGTVGSTAGVAASGTVSIGTRSGDLTLAAGVATSNNSASALVLNAGTNAAAGTASGGNLVSSGSPAISVGAGGTARLYTGSIAGSSLGTLTELAAGSGRFRYGSDESTSAYTTALAPGLNAVYRERPAVTVSVDNQAMTYADALPILTGTVSGSLANGDSARYAIVGRADASSGNIRAGSYTLAEATLAGLGYDLGTTSGSLTVAQRPMTLTGLLAADKVYDRSTAATVTSHGSLSGRIGSDAVTLSSGGASAAFADANAGSNKTVTVSGLALAGSDAANYSLASQTTTATVTPKALTVTGLSAADKVYDASTTASVSSAGLSLGGLVAGDSGAVTLSGASGSFDSKHVGNGKTVTLSYTLGGSALPNYRVTDQTATTASITPATLTLSGSSGVLSKPYDGSNGLPAGETGWVASGAGSLAGLLGSDAVTLSGRGVFASANVARDGGGNVIAQPLQRGTVALAGADAGNYTLAWTDGSAAIQPATLTVRADNAAKFVTTADPTFTLSYSGFVNGETAAVLSSVPTVSRPGAGSDEAAAVYTGALQVAGGAAGNYTISPVAGDFTIVPAGQLLVRAASGSSSYGVAPVFTIGTASYWDPTANGGAGGEIVLNGVSANGGNSFTVDDGASGSAIFTLAALQAANSTSGALKAGSYQLDLSGAVGGSSTNFSNTVTVVGTHQVNPVTLTAVVNAGAKTKVYDGQAAMAGLALDAQAAGVLAGDVVSLAGSGSFADKTATAGATKAYTVSGIVLDGADAANYQLAASSVAGSDGQITPRTLGVAFSGVNKVYDGSTGASVRTSDDRVAGDSLSILRSAAFGDRHVARDGAGQVIAKAVDVTGVSLAGTDAANYTVAATGSTTATITPAALRISGILGTDKTYDRTTVAPVDTTGLVRNGLVGSDVVTVSVTGSFADVHAEAAKAVSLSSTYGGTHVGNYSITGQSGTTASVLRRPVQVSAAGGVSKVYDGNTTMSGVSIAVNPVSGVAESGVVANDGVSVSGMGSFSSATVSRDGNGQVLSNKSYTLSNLVLGGASAADYMIVGGATSLSGSDGRIDPRTLSVTGFSAAGKTYDGSTAATILNPGSLDNPVSGDLVSASHTGASFADANAGGAKTVTLNGLALGGADAGNYLLSTTPVTTTASIARATLAINGSSAADKTYDGSSQASISVGTLAGLVGNETLGVTASGTLDNANAGPRTATARYQLADAQGPGTGLAANYTLADTTHAVTVAPKALTINGSSAADKTYDGSRSATVSAGALAGLVGSESLGVTASGLLDSANAGPRTATASYLLADGQGPGLGLAANYTLADTTHAVTVAPKALTITGSSAADKTYDGSSQASISIGTLAGLVGSEGLGVTASGLLDSANAGSRTATASYLLADAQGPGTGLAANYTLADTTHAVTVAPKALTISGLGSIGKVYDGSTVAAVSGTAVFATEAVGSGHSADGRAYLGDALSLAGTAEGHFNSRHAGVASRVSFSGLALTGAAAANYILVPHADALDMAISARPVTLTPAAVTRVYDGQVGYTAQAADLQTLSAQLGVNSDRVSAADLRFDNKNVGSGKTATLNGVTIDDGNGGRNYAPTLAANNASSISRLAQVTWVGGASGNWFDPANWAGGAVPDLANVAQVVFPAGTQVHFDATVVAPAQAGPVAIDSLAGGQLAQAAGSLQVGAGGMALAGMVQTGGSLASEGPVQLALFTQSGGSTTAASGLLVSRSVQQTGGTLVGTGVGAPLNLTQANGTLAWTDVRSSGDLVVQAPLGGISAGSTTVAGNLQAASAADITQTGPLAVAGTTALASGGDLRLSRVDNQFGGAVDASGRHIDLATTGDLVATLAAAGQASLQAGGNLQVAGNAGSLDAASGGAIGFGPTRVTGDLRSTTRGTGAAGGIRQSGGLDVGGTAQFIAATGTGQDALLDDATNRFGGLVSFSRAEGGSWREVNLAAADNLAVIVDASDQVTLTAGGNLAAAGNAGSLTTTSGGGTSFGATTVRGDLRSTAGGDISQTGPLQVGGNARLASTTGNISLADPANDFAGTGTASGRDITLADANGLRAVIDASGAAALTAGGDLAVAGSAASLTTSSGGSTTFGATTVSGDLRSTAGGDISQTGPLQVGGSTQLDSTGDIALAMAGNHFAGLLSAAGGNISLADDGALTLASVLARGELRLATHGTLTLGTTRVGGALFADSGNGDILQTGALQLGGFATLVAGLGQVVLTDAGNSLPLGSRIEASRYTLAGDARRAADEASAKALAAQAAPAVDTGSITAISTTPPPQPPALTLGTVTTSAGSSTSSAATAAPVANSAGVQIVVQPAPESPSGMMAAVSLPRGTATAGVGFSFELPESVRTLVREGETATVSLPSGAALQPWLRFDAKTLRFDAMAVPDGAFPLQVVISAGGQRMLVVISERND